MARHTKPIQAMPELAIGLVRSIGTELDVVEKPLKGILRQAQYLYSPIKLTDSIHQDYVPSIDLSVTGEYDRYLAYMNAGDGLRRATGLNDFIIRSSLPSLADSRRKSGKRGRAFVFRSLMHPDEHALLQQIYGNRYFTIAAYEEYDKRSERLAKNIAQGKGEKTPTVQGRVIELMHRDEGLLAPDDQSGSWRLNITKTFFRADLFVDAGRASESQAAVERFIRLIFSNPFHTPSQDEQGMAFAYSAALRSGALARPVGAAIMSPGGDLISVGMNDVAKPGGGQYWEGDNPDHRDLTYEDDPSDRYRRDVFSDLIARLMSDRWLRDELASSAKSRKKLGEALDGLAADPSASVDMLIKSEIVERSQLFDIIEFGRTIHAELSAITTAARNGFSTRDATLYVSTFPCHECTRNIVAAGIKRIVYVEPYPKSRLDDLYSDTVRNVSRSHGAIDGIHVEPFIGISPTRQSALFSWVDRKHSLSEGGSRVDWDIESASLRPTVSPTGAATSFFQAGLQMEAAANKIFSDRMVDLARHPE